MAKSPSALTSPSLGSTSAFDWSTGGLFTPDAAGPGLVQKQVVRVKGTALETLVVLYMKLAVPRSSNTQALPLFPDDGIRLKVSQVYPVSLAKGGKTVIPPDASRNLQRAAEILAFSRTNVLGPSVEDETSLSSAEKSSRPTKRAKITTSNFHVSLVIPPDSTDQSTSKTDDRSYFIAIVQFSISYTSSPPKWPYVVHIPLPRCLNNFLNFTIDESCVNDNTIVEVNPPLLPKPAPLVSIKSKMDNESETSKVNGGEAAAAENDQTLSGPFYSTPFLCIRWARADAGMVKHDKITSNGEQRPIRGELLDVSATFSNFKKVDNKLAEVDFQAEIKLSGIHYPGLDSTANFNLNLSPASGGSWKRDSVSLKPSRQSVSSLQSYSTVCPGNSSKHSIRTFSSNEVLIDRMLTPSPQPSSNDSSESTQEPDNTLDEDGNLLNVRPPKGLTSPNLDLSFDSDYDELDVSVLSVPSRMRNRRHSLGLRPQNAKHLQVDSINKFSPLASGTDQTIHTVLSLAALSQVDNEFVCNVEAKIQLKMEELDIKAIKMTLPFLQANGIALQYQAVAKDCQIVQKGDRVKVSGSDQDAIYDFNLPVNPSSTEVQDARVEVLVEMVEEKEEVISGNVSSATIAFPRHQTRTISDESLELLATERHQDSQEDWRSSTQNEQVDSLSGMIQEASVEVHSTLTLQEDLLLTEAVQRKVKTTHVIRFTWPSATAPSSNTLCGALLPRIVFALPCSDGEELQILYASVNGSCVQIGENSNGTTETESSRIIDIRLPDSLKNAATVQVFLLYVRVTREFGSLCIFPAVASSIAELKATFYYDTFHCQDSTFTFSNQPMNLSVYTDQSEKKVIVAHMLPSMTSAMASLAPRITTPIAITTEKRGPLRRTEKESKKVWQRRPTLIQSAGLFHIICTILLAIVLIGTIFNIEPLFESLSRKVDSLAMALDVDFSEGTWKPDASDNQQVYVDDKRDAIITSDSIFHEKNTNFDVSQEPNLPQIQISDEPHELSTDSRSFALLLESLSSSLTRSISWPFRLMYTIFRR